MEGIESGSVHSSRHSLPCRSFHSQEVDSEVKKGNERQMKEVNESLFPRDLSL